MDHPDFRVGGRVFATLDYPAKGHGMVTLPPDEQARLVKAFPDVFTPAKGAWGRSGSTTILLGAAETSVIALALNAAWNERTRKNSASRGG